MALRRLSSLRPQTAWLLLVGGLLIVSCYALLLSPIVAEDTDIFYHLAHGRYLFDHGEIPSTSYFSFISPAREWTDYYWLFQACVYSIHRAGGFFGLLVWRSLLFAGFLVTVAAFLWAPARHSKPASDGSRTWAQTLCLGGLLGFFLILFFHKFELVRPHALSYLFLAIFLYILEARPDKVLWLPIVAVLWTNFHGIEFPVMLLVAGAYLLEIWIQRLREQRASKQSMRTMIALGLSIAAVFATPHGAKLIKVPFVSTEYASHYILEHSQLEWTEFLTYRFSIEGPDYLSTFNLVLAMAILGAIGEALRRRLRISHLLMLAGGLILITKAIRLSHECALLALPLVHAFASAAVTIRWPKIARTAAALILVPMLMAPALFLRGKLPDFGDAYPLSPRQLPHGVVSFLNQVDAGGSVMNNPNVGGYLQWALDSNYRIFMDLEIPFLFVDEDIFEIGAAFFDAGALHRFLHRYQPDFISATLASTDFPALIAAHSHYVPVFFDDEGALYVDRRRHPEIVRDYALVHVEPFTLTGQRFSALAPEDRRGQLSELLRIATVDDGISSANQAIAILHNLDGRYDLAVEAARRVVAKNPRLARGHAVLGDAVAGLGEFDEAIRAYRRAIRRSAEDAERNAIYKSLSLAYFRADRVREAYEAFRRGVGKFNVEAPVDELVRLGVLAAAAGESHDARKMFDFALLKVSPDEVELRRQIEANLAALK